MQYSSALGGPWSNVSSSASAMSLASAATVREELAASSRGVDRACSLLLKVHEMNSHSALMYVTDSLNFPAVRSVATVKRELVFINIILKASDSLVLRESSRTIGPAISPFLVRVWRMHPGQQYERTIGFGSHRSLSLLWDHEQLKSYLVHSRDQLSEDVRRVIFADSAYCVHKASDTAGLLMLMSFADQFISHGTRIPELIRNARLLEATALTLLSYRGGASEASFGVYEAKQDSETDLRVARARNLIERLDSISHDVESLAKAVGLNRTTLRAEFKRRYGMTISACRQRQRLERAVSLLSRTNTPVMEIAESLGYACESSLNSALKRAFGATAQSIRRNPVLSVEMGGSSLPDDHQDPTCIN